MTQHPEVLWAQRSSETNEEKVSTPKTSRSDVTYAIIPKKKNVLYVTVNLPDIQESTLVYDLTPTSISVKAKSGE